MWQELRSRYAYLTTRRCGNLSTHLDTYIHATFNRDQNASRHAPTGHHNVIGRLFLWFVPVRCTDPERTNRHAAG